MHAGQGSLGESLAACLPRIHESGVENQNHERTTIHDNLYTYRRGAVAGDRIAAADHSYLSRPGRHRCHDSRHFGCCPCACRVSRLPVGRAAGQRRPCGTRPPDPVPGNQHHQTAEHQCLGTAAESRRPGTPVERLPPARLSRRAENRRRSGAQATLWKGTRQRRQSGLARG